MQIRHLRYTSSPGTLTSPFCTGDLFRKSSGNVAQICGIRRCASHAAGMSGVPIQQLFDVWNVGFFSLSIFNLFSCLSVVWLIRIPPLRPSGYSHSISAPKMLLPRREAKNVLWANAMLYIESYVFATGLFRQSERPWIFFLAACQSFELSSFYFL